MGVNYDLFQFVEQFDIPSGGKILDLGSQDLTIGTQNELEVINRFIEKRGGTKLKPVLPIVMESGEAWRAAGFTYNCIDVDKRPGTIFVDLQKFAFPKKMKNAYDLVLNWGTTEHLANPIGGLGFAHYVCRTSGLMVHDVPIFGFGNHGLTNPTPKFWHQIGIINNYQPLFCDIRKCDESLVDEGNFFDHSMEYMQGLKSLRGFSSIIRIAFKKPAANYAFIPPSDAVGSAPITKALALGSMRPLVACGVYSQSAARRSVKANLNRRTPTKLSARGRYILHRIKRLIG